MRRSIAAEFGRAALRSHRSRWPGRWRVGGCIGSRALRDLHPSGRCLCSWHLCGQPSTSGIDGFDLEEAEFKRQMLEKSERALVALENDKLATMAPFGVGPLSAIADLVVEADASGRAARRLRTQRPADASCGAGGIWSCTGCRGRGRAASGPRKPRRSRGPSMTAETRARRAPRPGPSEAATFIIS